MQSPADTTPGGRTRSDAGGNCDRNCATVPLMRSRSRKHDGSELIAQEPEPKNAADAGVDSASGRWAVGVGVPLTLPAILRSGGPARRANKTDPAATTRIAATRTNRQRGSGAGDRTGRGYAAVSSAAATAKAGARAQRARPIFASAIP